jgi:subtilase family serine protease
MGGSLNHKSLLLRLWMLLAFAGGIKAEEKQTLSGQVPGAVKRLNLQPMGRLPAATVLSLQIGLTLRNPQGFADQLKELYRPGGPQYHHWLTPQQIAAKYGPAEQDYQAVIALAQAGGLKVTSRQFDHTLLGVEGAVSDIEKMLHVKMQVYQHPVEDRTFFAPDVEPSLDLSVPLWRISGLDNFHIPRPAGSAGNPTNTSPTNTNPNPVPKDGGSGPDGSFVGNDFRNLYSVGDNQTGSGQMVGIYSQQDFYTNDILNYESYAGLPNVPITQVVVDPLDLYESNGVVNSGESSLDIEMVISMAPGIAGIIFYEGHSTNQVNILKRMQTDNLAAQLTCSYSASDPNNNTIFMMMAMQGQSMFIASGDHGAFCETNGDYNDDPYVTVVGGTVATTKSPGGAWESEVAWPGSGGGISASYSYTHRNVPDVAAIASGIFSIYGGGVTNDYVGGTSASTPLWAGLTALINEQAAASGHPSVGFLNPLIYAIGQGANYSTYFHDITNGNNTNSGSPNAYLATNGYDLCTGWGTPIGSNLIYLLAPTSNSVWVNFNYNTSSPQKGTFDNPYSTLSQGVSAVADNGNIFIMPGSSPQTLLITKPMTINAFSGAAIIGQ